MNNDNPTKNGFYVAKEKNIGAKWILIFKDGNWYDMSLKIFPYDVVWIFGATVHDIELMSPGLTMHQYFAAKRFLGLEVI